VRGDRSADAVAGHRRPGADLWSGNGDDSKNENEDLGWPTMGTW
jgi:hypothetical protein